MTRVTLANCVQFVTDHNRIVLVAMLVLTAGMLAGITMIDTEGQAGEDDFPETETARTADYIEDRYDETQGGKDDVAHSTVYVRAANGNALSKAALLDTLRYQQAVTDDETVATALAADGDGTERSNDRSNDDEPAVLSVATLVATAETGDPSADLETQIDALESMDEAEVESAVERTLADNPEAGQLVGERDDPETASAESQRLLFTFEAADDDGPPSDAQQVLFEEATDRDGGTATDLEYFTLGEPAMDEWNQQLNENTMGLLVPLTLAIILGVLAVTYRDPIDVVVGMVGVVTSIVWMFGILGWLGVGAGMTMFIGPVLIAGLSIDFGFHVFMRYREERERPVSGPEFRGQREAGDPIRRPMGRAVRSVAIALGLVTLTAGIGFLSNVVNPVDVIRDLGIGITLGVISAFGIFVTLVPALKISLEGLCERLGIDRHKRPLGDGTLLHPFLRSSVVLARRAAPLVIIVALVAGAGGAVAWTALDEEGVQQQAEPAAEWKGELPEPLAWEDPDYQQHQRYVQDEYRPMVVESDDRFQLLIEGDVTADGTLERVERGIKVGEENGAIPAPSERTTDDVRSPVTVMESVAADDDEFAATLEAADTTGDGIPDSDLESVYDHLYDVAPEEASQVIERTDGEYRSLRVLGPPEQAGLEDDRVDDVETMAVAIEEGDSAGTATDTGADDDDPDLTATAVSETMVQDSQLEAITDGILRVLVLALTAVFVSLVAIYRRVHGSATLGAVTALPIALVTGLVVGGMFVLDVPLTLLTALLMSLVIGLGIDYSIHISDRFAQEFERGREPIPALETAVTGTGGALLGSTLTSAGAFAALLVHPHPQLESFGTLVVLALVTAFIVSVFVLPSMLVLWARYTPLAGSTVDPAGTETGVAQE